MILSKTAEKGAYHPAGKQFGLDMEGGVFVNIDVKKGYIDEVIAVVKFYNPDVSIMGGIGF